MDLPERDEILIMDDRELAGRCELEFIRGSGRGGQKRNKTSSLVRVRLVNTDWVAEDCSERSQHLNRHRALRKLRMKIAFGCRLPPVVPERFDVALDHECYPLFAARLLDFFAFCGERISDAAGALGVSTGALNRMIRRDPALFQEVCRRREQAGIAPLKTN